MNNRPLVISPSLLGADLSNAAKALQIVSDTGLDYIHLDIMDGNFVDNITFGPKLIKDLRSSSDLIFDCHMMVERPENLIKAIAEAGADIITIHLEATKHPYKCLQDIKSLGLECGIAINPGTPVSAMESLLPLADYVLVMTVNPGFGGQKFIGSMLSKIYQLDELRKENKYQYVISADGGINADNAEKLYRVGCDMIVMGTAFFKEEDKGKLVDSIYAKTSDQK